MNKQILTLRIISVYFFISGVLTVIPLYLAKTSSVAFLTSTVIYIAVMIAISVGLFNLYSWARYAAIIALLLRSAQFLMVATRDIKTMRVNSVDVTTSVLMMVPITALYLLAIWWLSKSSTRRIFTHNTT
ncbi:MAG: hypothetical protein PHO83_08775 [Geobacteraceae bacterium]|nr:hypothetical protein [Geobacteraceae bacterium]